MKKRIRSILSLMLIAAMCIALTACGGTSQGDYIREGYEDSTYSYDGDPLYVEVSEGDVLYSDDYCTVTLASLDTNSDGGSTVTISVVNNYEVTIAFSASAYKTEKYESYVEKVEAGKNASVSPAENAEYSWVTQEGEDTEFEYSFDFSKEYIYFDIWIDKYSVFLTDDQLDSGYASYSDYYEHMLYNETVKVIDAE